VSYDSARRLIATLQHRPDARVVHAVWGFNMVHNSYAVVIKETKHAALLLGVGSQSTSGDKEQRGTEIPVLDGTTMNRFNAAGVFRVARSVDEQNRVSYWDGRRLYSQWNRQPNEFDYMD